MDFSSLSNEFTQPDARAASCEAGHQVSVAWHPGILYRPCVLGISVAPPLAWSQTTHGRRSLEFIVR